MGDANNGTPAGTGGSATETAPAAADAAKGGASTAPPASKVFSQDEVNRLLAKERRALEEKFSGISAQVEELAALKEAAAKAEEAKLSAVEREKRDREREREKYTAELSALKASSERERALRHDAMRSHVAAKLVAEVSARLHTPELAPVLSDSLVKRLLIEDDGKGGERVMLRGDDGEHDVEPVETGWARYRDSQISRAFFRAQPGSGAQHGRGGNGASVDLSNLPATDRILAGLQAQKR